MLDLFQIAINYCDSLLPLVKVVHTIFNIIQWGIPVLLILFGTIDLGKAVISSDDKEVKAAQSRLIKRCIYAVAVFFIVILVELLMDVVSDSLNKDEDKGGSWIKCWNKAV